ncbi:MAG TPA: uridine kinase [Candidatus Krumholzibacterium sp.]|nr:uridine kinase [Candidatus Krumholzibacterium sp.]
MSFAPLFIGIAGGSCSGKTTLARSIAQAIGARPTVVLSLDSYYRDLRGLSPKEKAAVNFDHPGAIDEALAVLHLGLLAEGETVRIPLYDFRTHSRTSPDPWPESSVDVTGPQPPVIIIEGLFVLHFPAIRDLLDLAVFVKASHRVCLQRRLDRDVKERGRTPGSVRARFESMTRPMYDEFVLPTASFADLVVDGEQSLTGPVATIVSMIPSA